MLHTANLSGGWKPRKSILVVEDSMLEREALVEVIRAGSNSSEFECAVIHEAATGEEAMSIARSADIDLAILDVSLAGGGMNGYETCAELRKAGFGGRIIMLSEVRKSAEDRADGLDLGADDFMSKPYSEREMRSRIENQLRAGENSVDPMLHFGPFTLFPGRKMIRLGDGSDERLTEKEARILHWLYLARGRVVGRQELLEEVWGYHPAARTHTLETHIYRIRRKIEPTPDRPRYVLAADGGYRIQREVAFAQ